MLLQAKRSFGRIADSKLHLRCLRIARVAEIASRLGGAPRGQRIGDKFRSSSITSYSVLRRCSCRAASSSPPGSVQPGHLGEALHRLDEIDALVAITKSKMLPCLPVEKSVMKTASGSFTVNSGVFFLLERRQPLELPPLPSSA